MSPAFTDVRIIRESELKEKQKQDRDALRLKKFGKPGPKVKVKVPSRPPRTIHAPPGSKRGRVIVGVSTLVEAQGGYADIKGRKVYVTINSAPFARGLTSDKAQNLLPLLEDSIKRLYSGRLNILSFKHTFRKRG